MSRMIFVNLPVRDVGVSADFYRGLGFALNPMFSDGLCRCVVVSESICIMALQQERFADFLAGPVADPRTGTSVINCLSADSRAEVDTMVDAALAHGGSAWLDPFEDGPMYGHSFADPDGHVWEVLYMAAGCG